MLDAFADWLNRHETLFWALSVLSVVTAVATLVVVPRLVARLPSDYFLREHPRTDVWRQRHPLLRYTFLALKNLIGLVLLAAGVVMLVSPGQGVLTVLIGLMLIDFPGKRKLELWIVRRRAVLRTINWMRAKSGRDPLQLPDRVD